MAKRLNLVMIATLAIVALLQSSLAQRDYVVGDALGWVIPPGPSTYTTWAANKTFRVGDTLVFNFSNGAHDVTKVTRANYDSCNAGNPILMLSNGPANVTLNETGSHYFICGIPGHCALGQKLAINVSAAGLSPAPQPITPPASSPMPSAPAPAPQGSPSPSPVSGPTRSPVTYTVGDSSGWTVSSNGASFYQTWANGKNFMIGDILVFNYVTGIHDVLEVSRSSYQQCNASNPILNLTTPPTRVTLRTAGEHYYICSVPGHCTAGQQLAINVSSSSTATPPSSSSPSPSTSSATPPSPTNPSSPGDNNASPPTPGNSEASMGAAGLSATFVSLIVAFFM
ncbi:blue-copper-binding protein, BLUE COPPER BINDING PROTEIN, SENESCENCE ASSOCIATED GENE 14 [Hibiscus trionum]|uniref:Blue-copper-binding protein, BLUE COPPER BINDING PROTEIN, SENESCENCE ASSOCIATED GENE 14 n=1 Tax=Hibiscus trionum TaxID=183268 RepID=A0A9W7J6I2_HIBTR|nr:blue-copper-binding protein, BLUE COPPER BINDING PROTEIN, SENESCENCE ASSOCIATED GENE 14 [Hibiscus trionum]